MRKAERTLVDLFEERLSVHPDRRFLLEASLEPNRSPREFTYAAFDRRIGAAVRALAGAGVEAGDRVVVHLLNTADAIAVWFALGRLSAVMVAANPGSAADELRFLREHSRAKLIVEDPAACSREDGPPLPARRARPEEDAAILYTSGTTSRPKGVRITHANYLFAAEGMVENTALTSADVHGVCAPLFHVNAQAYSILPALVAGCEIVLLPRFSRSRWLPLIRAHRVTIASMATAMLRMLMDNPPSAEERDRDAPLGSSKTRLDRTPTR
jgi:crotonobetaine/carnitine-CoA ligase